MTLLFLTPGWIQFIQFFVALSLLIILHEWGHYYAARRTGTRVEKFFLFFDFFFPFGNVLPFALWRKKKGDTEFGIGWFPLGGYVKIAGMMDESADKEALAAPPKPDEFRSKTAPQRLLIMLGGIVVNVLIAIIAYWLMFAKYGESKLPMKSLTYGLFADSLAKTVGLRDGDMITAVNGKPIEYYGSVTRELAFSVSTDKVLTIVRDGKTSEVKLPPGTVASILKRKSFMGMRIPFTVDSVGSNVKFSGDAIAKGDKILSFAGAPAAFLNEYAQAQKALKDSLTKAKLPLAASVTVTVLRGADTIATTATLDTTAALGVYVVNDIKKIFKHELTDYNIAAAFKRGLSYTWENTVDYARGLRALFQSKEMKVKDNLGGFGTFVSRFPDTWTLEGFLNILAYVSVILAFMNLLPIPGLDGGYVLFLLIEMITGRKPGERFMEIANTIGLVLLLGLMLYANGLDIVRAIFK
ncbi:MAG: hypothetical protein RL660_625 [Bacteroidota bacterium]|jgi:regulator of sigma E protease